MGTVEDSLKEDYIYFLEELLRVEREWEALPKGSISAKKIHSKIYYYHQFREGKKVISKSLGPVFPGGLAQEIQRRKRIEAQKKEIKKNLKTISRALGKGLTG